MLSSRGISKETVIRDFLNQLIKEEYKIIFGVDAPTETKEKKLKLQFWIFPYKSLEDTLKWDEFLSNQIKGSNGIVIMYDITDAETLDWVSGRIQAIKNNLDYVPPVMLLGNKLEVEENREVSIEQVTEFKEANDISSSMEVSLKTGENIEKTFMELTEMMLRNTEADYQIEISRIPTSKGYKHLGILIAVIIYVISIVTSLIAYLVFLVF
jgi:Ras-related protein Rab-1A